MLEYRVWDHLVYKYGDCIGRKVTYKDKTWKFFGLVIADDDYYFGLCRKNKGPLLVSCVGDMESWGIMLSDAPWPERLGWKEWIAAGGPSIPDNSLFNV